MSEEDVIGLALQAGCHTTRKQFRFTLEELTQFADLCTLLEREACAKVCDDEADECAVAIRELK